MPTDVLDALDAPIRAAAYRVARAFALDWWWRQALYTVGQERVWRKQHLIQADRGSAAARSWAYRTARVAMLSELREWRRGKRLVPTPAHFDALEDVPETCGPTDPERSFDALVGDLGASPAEAEVLKRRFLYGDELQEVAARLGYKSKTSAYERLAAACDRLRGGTGR